MAVLRRSIRNASLINCSETAALRFASIRNQHASRITIQKPEQKNNVCNIIHRFATPWVKSWQMVLVKKTRTMSPWFSLRNEKIHRSPNVLDHNGLVLMTGRPNPILWPWWKDKEDENEKGKENEKMYEKENNKKSGEMENDNKNCLQATPGNAIRS